LREIAVFLYQISLITFFMSYLPNGEFSCI